MEAGFELDGLDLLHHFKPDYCRLGREFDLHSGGMLWAGHPHGQASPNPLAPGPRTSSAGWDQRSAVTFFLAVVPGTHNVLHLFRVWLTIMFPDPPPDDLGLQDSGLLCGLLVSQQRENKACQ